MAVFASRCYTFRSAFAPQTRRRCTEARIVHQKDPSLHETDPHLPSLRARRALGAAPHCPLSPRMPPTPTPPAADSAVTAAGSAQRAGNGSRTAPRVTARPARVTGRARRASAFRRPRSASTTKSPASRCRSCSTITKNGRMQQMMPPWKGRLDDQQIWDTVAYAWGLHTTRAEVDQGKVVYEANCASCHGADGKGKAAHRTWRTSARPARPARRSGPRPWPRARVRCPGSPAS